MALAWIECRQGGWNTGHPFEAENGGDDVESGKSKVGYEMKQKKKKDEKDRLGNLDR